MPSAKLSTPDRKRLIARYRAVNAMAKGVLVIEAVTIVAAAVVFLDWPFLIRNWIYTLIVAGMAAGSEWMGLILFALQKKTTIDQLGEQAVLGQYNKHSIKALIEGILRRLRIPRGAVAVYLVRSKEINAFALPTGLLPFSRSANVMQINRSILHVLDPDELASVVGHELGHLTRYDFAWFRHMLLHGLVAVVIGLLILQHLRMDEGAVFFAIAVALTVFYWIVHLPLKMMSRDLEFLCDDFGACVAGVVPAINAELKIGSALETHTELLLRAIEMRRQGSDLGAKELLEVYQKSLPFGQGSPEAMMKELERQMKHREREKAGVSVGGFWDYLNSDRDEAQDDAFDELRKTMKKVQKTPRIDWTAEFLPPGATALNESRIAALVERIEQNPDHVLFHLPEEVKDDDSTHPGTRRRILYLWRNREAIAREAF